VPAAKNFAPNGFSLACANGAQLRLRAKPAPSAVRRDFGSVDLDMMGISV
jgi:hypothetical protein